MHLTISSVLSLMKYTIQDVKTVRRGAHLLEPCSILSRKKLKLPQVEGLALVLSSQLEL